MDLTVIQDTDEGPEETQMRNLDDDCLAAFASLGVQEAIDLQTQRTAAPNDRRRRQ